MRVLKENGTKERLFEMMNRVNTKGTKFLFESDTNNYNGAKEFIKTSNIDFNSEWEQHVDGQQDSIEHKNNLLNSEDSFYEWIEGTYLTGEPDVTNEEENNKINEISWDGIKKAGKYVKDKAVDKTNAVVDDISDAVKQKVSDVSNRIGDIGNQIASEYHKGSKNNSVGKLEKIANKFGDDFGKMIGKINASAVKAGEEEINVQSLAQSISNSIVKSAKSGGSSSVNLNKFRTESIDDYKPMNVGDMIESNIDYPQTGEDAEAMSNDWEEKQDVLSSQKNDITISYTQGMGSSQLDKAIINGERYSLSTVDELNQKLSELGVVTQLDPRDEDTGSSIVQELKAMGVNANFAYKDIT